MKKYIFISLTLILVFAQEIKAQEVHKEIVSAFEKGNARKLSGHFHHHLELKLPDARHVVSKSQGTLIMKEFFENHPPEYFSINYEGTKQGTDYAIGEYSSGNIKFRVNIYFLDTRDSGLIYQITIEQL